jgi:ADP-ribose pyrophosphatase YjhB (NUDIX family)
MEEKLKCPHCGEPVTKFKNPIPTVDIIIEVDDGIILINRKNPPYGWAIPGGFIDYGESAEDAAMREAKEETSMEVINLQLMNVYSAPDRDPRQHTISIVFMAKAKGKPKANDDAKDIAIYDRETLPSPLAFDHGKILIDYYMRKENKVK